KENIKKISSGNKNEIMSIATNRVQVWVNTLPLFKRYWLFGAGIDNFRDIYPQSGYISYDKAHNVYLQIGITNGIPALVVYMIICFIPFAKGFKLNDKFSHALYMAFVTYCIQAFANISVIDVAPYFFLILGLLIHQTDKERLEFKKYFKINKKK
ncbi:MAG: O-antigen ligase family protein, partial [Bacilli bacterium]